MFTTSEDDLEKALHNFQKDAPEPLTSQFTERRSKPEAIQHRHQRNSTVTPLFPSGKCLAYYNISVLNSIKNSFYILNQLFYLFQPMNKTCFSCPVQSNIQLQVKFALQNGQIQSAKNAKGL